MRVFHPRRADACLIRRQGEKLLTSAAAESPFSLKRPSGNILPPRSSSSTTTVFSAFSMRIVIDTPTEPPYIAAHRRRGIRGGLSFRIGPFAPGTGIRGHENHFAEASRGREEMGSDRCEGARRRPPRIGRRHAAARQA